jgi:hypothetical protein
MRGISDTVLFNLQDNQKMKFIKGFKSGFKDFGHLINNIINTILLTILYIVAVGPTFLILKLNKKKLLKLEKDAAASTYWSDYDLTTEPEENYYRQF